MKTFKKFLTEEVNKTHIKINGELKHRYNSENKLIHHTDDGINNFHRWFGDSDSVDESGKPLVVYHGVPALESGQYDHTPLPFNEFTKSNSGLFSFSKSKTFAERYASTKSMDSGMDLSPYVFPVYLKTKTFDPDNKEHIDLLRKHLPDTVQHQGKYGWSAWGGEQQIPKEKFLERLQGIHDVYRPLTKEAHTNAVVGKSITLDGGRVYVHHKNETHLFTSAEYQLDNMTKENLDSLKIEAEKEPEKSVQKKIRIFPEHGRNWVFKDRVVSIHPITYLPAKAKGDNWEETENNHLKSVLKNLGFNAIKQTERGQHNIAVFDGNQIKSATHNQGEFDQLKNSIVESVDHPMIDVDGELKHRNNSLGQPIHHTDEGIKNFHRWFANDSNVDEHGRPKVLYHSSLKDIVQFDSHGQFMGYTGTSGISLTDSPEMASRYLDRYGDYGYVDGLPYQPFDKNVIPVYAKIGKVLEKNEPFKNNIQLGSPLPKNYIPEHKRLGYNTLIRDDAISRGGVVKHSTAKNAIRGKEYVLTSPDQIKSVLGNNGNYSSTSSHISESADHWMIMLDGVQRHVNNSLGQPIHHTMDGIYNFHRWFGNSKTVDEHGRPQVYYHGTGSDIDKFSHEFTGKGVDAYGPGFYFAEKSDTANTYTGKENGNIVPVYLRLHKPIDRDSNKEFTHTQIARMIAAAPNHKDNLQNFGEVTNKNYLRVLSSAADAYSGSPKFHQALMLHNDFYQGDHQTFLKNLTKITGHDGIVVNDSHGKIINMFHPEHIKSATGNFGRYSKKSHNLSEEDC